MQEFEKEKGRYSSPIVEIAAIQDDVLTLSDDPFIDDEYGVLFG